MASFNDMVILLDVFTVQIRKITEVVRHLNTSRRNQDGPLSTLPRQEHVGARMPRQNHLTVCTLYILVVCGILPACILRPGTNAGPASRAALIVGAHRAPA